MLYYERQPNGAEFQISFCHLLESKEGSASCLEGKLMINDNVLKTFNRKFIQM